MGKLSHVWTWTMEMERNNSIRDGDEKKLELQRRIAKLEAELEELKQQAQMLEDDEELKQHEELQWMAEGVPAAAPAVVCPTSAPSSLWVVPSYYSVSPAPTPLNGLNGTYISSPVHLSSFNHAGHGNVNGSWNFMG